MEEKKIVNEEKSRGDRVEERKKLEIVELNIGNGEKGKEGLNRRIGEGGGKGGKKERIERKRNDIVRKKEREDEMMDEKK